MATTDVAPQGTGGQLGRKRVVNDMSIQVATVNGSGSQSSNTVLLRAIFQMGVPVSGKNLFPSIRNSGGSLRPSMIRKV